MICSRNGFSLQDEKALAMPAWICCVRGTPGPVSHSLWRLHRAPHRCSLLARRPAWSHLSSLWICAPPWSSRRYIAHKQSCSLSSQLQSSEGAQSTSEFPSARRQLWLPQKVGRGAHSQRVPGSSALKWLFIPPASF